MSDKELEGRLKDIDRELKAYSLRLTKDPQDAHDLFQDTYIKVWTNREKYIEDKSFTSWCHTIMYNTFINNVQLRKKQTVVSPDSHRTDGSIRDTQSIESFLAQYKMVAYNQAETNITLADIEDSINKLQGVHREVVIRKLSGETFNEIAKHVKLSNENCKVKYHYAIRKVREDLTEKFNLTTEYKNKKHRDDTNT